MNSSPKEYKGFTRRQAVGDPEDLKGYGRTLLERMGYFSEVTYEEIDSWANAPPKIKVPRWEREAMVLAMKAYRNMEIKAREMACPNPMLSEEEAQAAIADHAFSVAKSSASMMGRPLNG